MSMPIDLQDILVFCIAQMLVLIFILFQKRYRVFPNLLLGIVFFILILYYVYYLIIHSGLLDDSPVIDAGLKSIGFFPPVIIYIYVNLVISGHLKNTRKEIFLMFSGFYLSMALLIPLLFNVNNQYLAIYNIVVGEIMLLYYLIFAILIFRTLALFCGTEQGVIKSVFKFSNPRFNWLRIIAIMFSIHTIILLIEVNLGWFLQIPEIWFEVAMIIYLIILSYVFLYGIINYPEVIHIDKKQIGLKDAKKYARPNLSIEESKQLMKKMNAYMNKYKPWLNPEFCMADFSENIHVSAHLISEVTNGLMKQNFFDYVNNYRIEEFKRLLLDPEKKMDKIQFLAYDAGFNSKTTFNTAFKKFTGKTPSEYKRALVN